MRYLLPPRWRKVWADLWANRTRTLLAVISIVVGVFALGTALSANEILLHDVQRQYMAANPPSAFLYVNTPFDDELLNTVRRLPGVAAAAGVRTLNLKVSLGGQWQQLQLTVVPDFHKIAINKIRLERGEWPHSHELAFNRGVLAKVTTQLGDRVIVELPDGRKREMAVSGFIHDMVGPPPIFMSGLSGYIGSDTLDWFGLPRDYNEMDVLADQPLDKQYIDARMEQVRSKVEQSGRQVGFIWTPTPGESPAQPLILAMTGTLGVLGGLMVLLSAFLIVNIVGALLQQQTRQIGVMKAIGATTGQLVGMYLTFALGLGLLALLIAAPLAVLAASLLSSFLANLFNFDLNGFRIVGWVIIVQTLVALLLPLLAALVPVLSGARISVREAITSYGVGKGNFGKRRLDRMLERVRFLPRPMLLSLRNTFRRKGRLALTLVTLTLAGSIFIAVLSVRQSFSDTMDSLVRTYFADDVRVQLEHADRIDQIDEQALRVPGVARTEYWASASGRFVRPGGGDGVGVTLVAPPSGTNLFKPEILAGRWLLPQDQNAVVVNSEFITHEPLVGVGSDIVLKINGRKSVWHVVGIVPKILNDTESLAYANYDYAATTTRSIGVASTIRVVTTYHDAAFQAQVAAALEQRLNAAGLRVEQIQTPLQWREPTDNFLAILVVFLIAIAALITVVGGLGLMGTMSINVIERTREIGVMRAVGASDGAIQQIVIVEGILIALVSWAFSALLSLPLSAFFCQAMGMALIQTPLPSAFAISGLIIWLLVVTGLGALASFLPAWNASRLTVRDVLAYE